ncbi:hypothetical protein [Streptomyces sp. NPDC006552]|uniref:hypothetical protein n=1 Tax=Streptomyces sp. NPDC006552 TaxID=3157179 RepID=UPI0033A89A3A
MNARRPVTAVITAALLALGAVSVAEGTALHSAVAANTSDSGWGSVEPPVASGELRTAVTPADSGWGSIEPPKASS